jgi:hypothetical protein
MALVLPSLAPSYLTAPHSTGCSQRQILAMLAPPSVSLMCRPGFLDGRAFNIHSVEDNAALCILEPNGSAVAAIVGNYSAGSGSNK